MATAHTKHHDYHLVDPSPWPLVGAFSGGAFVLGIVLLAHYGIWWMLYLGVASVIVLRPSFSWSSAIDGST